MKTTKMLLASLVAAGMLGGLSLSTAPAFAEPPAGKGKSEAKQAEKADKKAAKEETKGSEAKIGAPAPAFTLTDLDGKAVNLSDFQDKIVVLEWFNPGCPVVVMHHQAKTMQTLQQEYASKGVVWLAINSGAPGKQGHGKELNQKMAKEWNVNWPVLLDESGTVGRSYGAKTTPHMYIVNKGTLVYNGAIDDGSPRKVGSTNYVKAALDEILAGKPVTTAETKPYGCSVKY